MSRTFLFLALFCFSPLSFAQAQISKGFEYGINADATNAELVRQGELWVMQVQYKAPRMVWSEVLDPVTNTLKREQIWYLAWRSIVRPVSGRQDNDTLPVNQRDPLPGPSLFIPQFTLVTYDDPKTEIPNQLITDSIIPNAVQQIQKTETRDGDGITYKDSVSVIQPVPEPTPVEADQQNWIYGVATWKGVDPETDFFKILFHGFSNAYEVRGEGETAQVWRKIFVQKGERPGDRFDPNQREFTFTESSQWIYQPDNSEPVEQVVNTPPAAE